MPAANRVFDVLELAEQILLDLQDVPRFPDKQYMRVLLRLQRVCRGLHTAINTSPAIRWMIFITLDYGARTHTEPTPNLLLCRPTHDSNEGIMNPALAAIGAYRLGGWRIDGVSLVNNRTSSSSRYFPCHRQYHNFSDGIAPGPSVHLQMLFVGYHFPNSLNERNHAPGLWERMYLTQLPLPISISYSFQFENLRTLPLYTTFDHAVTFRVIRQRLEEEQSVELASRIWY